MLQHLFLWKWNGKVPLDLGTCPYFIHQRQKVAYLVLVNQTLIWYIDSISEANVLSFDLVAVPGRGKMQKQ